MMSKILNLETVVIGVLLFTVGTITNSTRTAVSGTEFYLWMIGTAIVSMLIAIGVQYTRHKTTRG